MTAPLVGNARAGNNQTATTSTLTIVIPAGASAGDYAILQVGSVSDTDTLTTPTGWSLLSGPDRVDIYATGWLFGRTLTAADAGASVTLTFSGSHRCAAEMSVYTGVVGTGRIVAKIVETVSDTSAQVPTIGTVSAGGLFHASWVRRYGGTPAPDVTPPAGYTVGSIPRAATTYGSTPELSVEVAYQVATTSGSYGGEQAAVSSPSIGVDYAVALRPSAVNIVGVAAKGAGQAPVGLVVVPPSASDGFGTGPFGDSPFGSATASDVTIVGVPATGRGQALAGDITGGSFVRPPVTTEWPPPPYRTAIRSSLTIYYTVDATFKGLPVQGATGLQPLGGAITDTNRPGVRRTLELELADDDGTLLTSLAPTGTRLSVTAHVRYTDRTEQPIPMGVFVVDTGKLSEGSGQLSLTADDKWVQIQRAKFLKPKSSSRGMLIVNQIAALVRGALGQAETVNITATSKATVAQLTWDQDRDQAIIDLANQIGAWVFFDRDGVCTIADVPRMGAVAKWLIDASANGVLLDVDRELSRTDSANVVVVESTAADDEKFPTVVVWDSDPDSVTYAGPDPVAHPELAGQFGVVPTFESSPNLTTQQEAVDFAGAVLSRKVGLLSQISLSSTPNPAIDAFDPIDVLPPGQQPVGLDANGQVMYRAAREVERHVVETVIHPLDVESAQQITGRATSITLIDTPTVDQVKASFTAAPTSGATPLTVQFLGTSTGNPTTFRWDFGDGSSPVTTRDASHTYSTAGTYTVTYTVSNQSGADSTTTTVSATSTPSTPTIFGYNYDPPYTTLAQRQTWWGRAPMVRKYDGGMLPATFQFDMTDAPEKRVAYSFKPDGTYPVATLASGGGTSRMTSWLNSIPAGWTVYWIFYHEPGDDFRAGKLTSAQYVQVYAQMRVALNAASLHTGVRVRIAACFSAFQLTDPSHFQDAWVPPTIDVLAWDAYGNPNGGGDAYSTGSNRYGTATGSGYGTRYPLPELRFKELLDANSRLGFAQHWAIFEINAPDRNWDSSESVRARWLTDSYNYLLGQPYPPEVVLLWENPTVSFATWDQEFGRQSGSPTACVNALAPFIKGSP